MRPLTVPMRDAWLLTAEAVAADLIPSARLLAERAVELSGWDRYTLSTAVCGTQVRTCDLMPRGWAYHHRRSGWDQLLLLHPQGREFVTETPAFGRLMVALKEAGGGLVRIDEVLGVVLLGSLEAPDSPQGL